VAFPLTNIIYFSIILLTGVLTVSSDIHVRKIYNRDLFLGTVLGLAAMIYARLWAHEDIVCHLVNGLAAFVIGLVLYRLNEWRGGDAKLFTLYAFLMPPPGVYNTLLSSAINLFACSFISGSILLLPLFIKIILTHQLKSSLHNIKGLLKTSGRTVLISWAFFPVYYAAIFHFSKFVNASIIFMTVTLLILFSVRFFLEKILENQFVLAGGFILGFLMRLWLEPHSLSCPVLPYSVLKIVIYCAISVFIYGTFDHLKENRDRIPFAPLLLVGCVLSYTPFLTWIMHSTKR